MTERSTSRQNSLSSASGSSSNQEDSENNRQPLRRPPPPPQIVFSSSINELSEIKPFKRPFLHSNHSSGSEPDAVDINQIQNTSINTDISGQQNNPLKKPSLHLKIEIPHTSDDSNNSSSPLTASSMLKTPVNFTFNNSSTNSLNKSRNTSVSNSTISGNASNLTISQNQSEIDKDIKSVLDDIDNSWMPSMNLSPPKRPQSYVSTKNSFDSTGMRNRKRKSRLSFRFHNDSNNSIVDLEHNIPLDDLNLSPPKIKVDDYMQNNTYEQSSSRNDGISGRDDSNSAGSNNNIDTNNPEIFIEGTNLDELEPTKEIAPPETKINRGRTIGKMFAKLSNLVNSDEINDGLDDDGEQGDRAQNDGNENILEINNPNIDNESIFTYYLNESERRILSENGEMSTDQTAENNINTDYANPFSDRNQINEDSPHLNGEELPLYGNSLKLFSPNSTFRKSCFFLLTYPILNQIFTSMITIQVVLLSYQQWTFENGYVYNKGYTWVDWILFCFYIIYTGEIIMKNVAFGFYDDKEMRSALKLEKYDNQLSLFYGKVFTKIKKNTSKFYKILRNTGKKEENNDIKQYNIYTETSESDKIDIEIENDAENVEIHTRKLNEIKSKYPLRYAFLKNDWNKIDLISIASFWISFFFSIRQSDIGKAQIFRSLMCLKILRLLNTTKGSRIILRSLRDSALQARQVLLFLLCFWVLFSIIGVESFKSSLRRHCVWTNPSNSTDTYSYEFQFCGSYLSPIDLKPMPYLNADLLSSTRIKGFTCPAYSECIITDNPYNGRVSFDNFVHSMQSVFVIISANTFTDLMYYTMDSDSMVASLFYIISLFVLTVWLINLVVAVIIHSYKFNDHKESENSCLSNRMKIYEEYAKTSKVQHYWSKINFIFVSLILLTFIYDATKNPSYKKQGNYDIIDFIANIIFVIEIVLRFCLCVYDGFPQVFFYSISNCVDLALAIFPFVFCLPPVSKSLSAVTYGWLTVFGIIRFYRVVNSVSFARNAWALALRRIRPFIQLIFFGAHFLYFTSIIMSRLFEGIVPSSEMDNNPWVMYNLPNCIVSLFIITTTENWTTVLYSTEQYSQNTFTSFCVAVYLILWFIMSNTVLLSIFIAIITSNLELSEDDKKINQIRQFIKSCIARIKKNEHEGLVDLFKNNFNGDTTATEARQYITHMNELLIKYGRDPIDIESFNDDDDDLVIKSIKRWLKTFSKSRRYNLLLKYFRLAVLELRNRKNRFFKEHNKVTDILVETNLAAENDLLDETTSPDQNVPLEELNPFGDEASLLFDHNRDQEKAKIRKKQKIDRSLFIFTNENLLRRFCQIFVAPVHSKRRAGREPSPKLMYAFNVFMFLSSVLVVILACYVTPLYRKENNLNTINMNWDTVTDIVFLIIFTIEFAMKIIADGLLIGERAYFKSTWNILDFLVLISFWFTVFAAVLGKYSLLITFNAVRALRAFRLLTITKESQMIFHFAIISGAVKIFSAALVSLSLLLPFALWGFNIFGENLSYCADGISTVTNCSLEFSNQVFKWEILSPNYVETPYLNFSTFGSSVSSLFQILSLEGWVDLLSDVVNVTKSGYQPSLFASPENGLFIILFILCSTIFIINLFISIIINHYSLQTGVAFLNDEQHGWYEVKKVLRRVRPPMRRQYEKLNALEKRVFDMTTNPKSTYRRFINLVLLTHFCLLVAEAYPSSLVGDLVKYGFFVFTTLTLLIHMLLVQYSVGLNFFYSNKWNIIMMTIIFTSLVLTCISFSLAKGTIFTNIHKTFLVAVLGMIIPQVDMLNQLIKYGSTALFSLVSLLYTWLVLFLVFAIALNQFFGLTRLGPNTTGNLNARTVTKSLIMLFRNSFGEGWNYIMDDFKLGKPYCYDNGFGDSDCGNSSFSLLLFICWNILSMYIFLNILISVIINNFSYVYHGSGPHKLITREEIRKFTTAWYKFDKNCTGYIDADDLSLFLQSLDGVLSYHVYPKYLSIPTIVSKTITVYDPYNHYDIYCDTEKLEELLSIIDYAKIRQRRIRYNRLVSEMLRKSTEIINDSTLNPTIIRKLPFKEVILLVGYYSRFEDSTCLNLEDYLRHSAQIKSINRELRKIKIVSIIKMIYTRLRYKYLVDKCGILQRLKDASPAEKARLKKEIVSSLKGNDVSYDSLTNYGNGEIEDPYNPIYNNNLYRVMSSSSRNPFSDAYGAHNESYDSL